MRRRSDLHERLHVIALRADQWELIVLALQRVRALALPAPSSEHTADVIGRQFLRSRCEETIAHIHAAKIPGTGGKS